MVWGFFLKAGGRAGVVVLGGWVGRGGFGYGMGWGGELRGRGGIWRKGCVNRGWSLASVEEMFIV